MGEAADQQIKLREVRFCAVSAIPEQAHSAAAAVSRMDGVRHAEPLAPTVLQVSYDLRCLSLEDIEQALCDSGFHLDNSLLCKLRRALVYYVEDTQRANLGCPRGSTNCTQRVFVNRYRQIEHGCRDHRPEHWRRYL